MNRICNISLKVIAATLCACSARAEDDSAKTSRANQERTRHVRQTDRLNGAAKTSDLIGMTVKNHQDEKLGKVEDLAIDVESGRIVQVILSTGGIAGIGDTLTAVPPGDLHHDVAQKVLHLNVDKETFKNAPKFETAKWAEYSDKEHLAEVYKHYNEETAFNFVQKGDTARNAAPNTISSRKADRTWNKERLSSDSQSMIPVSRLSQVQKASKLQGMTVKNQQDEKLGDVENILVDLPSGRVVALIVSSGGFLGMGDELSAVPAPAFRFTTDRDTLQLDATKKSLSQAPHFKSNEWPDFNKPDYAKGVYQAYNVEPYFTTDADNTARNVRDRREGTLTPTDQGNSKPDVMTTAQIRKEIIATKSMSVNAQNVKIITQNGQVTLRGPVNNAEEKRLIGEIAGQIAQGGNVDNQLEVKADTGSGN